MGGWFARLAGAVVLAAVSTLPASAGGKVVHTTEYRNHAVSGTTPAAVIRSMTTNPIIDPDDGPAYANLTHDHSATIKTAMSGGRCTVADLTFRWKFVLTLPQASDFERMSPAVKGMWTDFRASMKRHEEGHRTLFLKCGAAFVPAAAKLTAPSCGALEASVRRYLDKQYAACMAKQRDYEKGDRPRVMSAAFLRAALGR